MPRHCDLPWAWLHSPDLNKRFCAFTCGLGHTMLGVSSIEQVYPDQSWKELYCILVSSRWSWRLLRSTSNLEDLAQKSGSTLPASHWSRTLRMEACTFTWSIWLEAQCRVSCSSLARSRSSYKWSWCSVLVRITNLWDRFGSKKHDGTVLFKFLFATIFICTIFGPHRTPGRPSKSTGEFLIQYWLYCRYLCF